MSKRETLGVAHNHIQAEKDGDEMTREQVIKLLKEVQAESDDIKEANSKADRTIRQFLLSLGYEDVVKEWDQTPKCYH